MIELDSIHHTDLLTLCSMCEPQSIDMILCDLPYGTTDYEWDKVVPIEPMWSAFKRIISPTGAIILTASQPFTSVLIASNLSMFKYEWIWVKARPSGFLHAKNKPLKTHENILVFSAGDTLHAGQSKNRMAYYPQMGQGKPYVKHNDPKVNLAWSDLRRPSRVEIHTTTNMGNRYPTSVLEYPNDNHDSLHPTQKPVALFEYLIRTYTQAGEVVLDPCVGSGTTAVAARNTGRRYITGDITKEYVEIACERLAAPYMAPLFIETPDVTATESRQEGLEL